MGGGEAFFTHPVYQSYARAWHDVVCVLLARTAVLPNFRNIKNIATFVNKYSRHVSRE
jgi:hypothetical protein